MVVYVQEMSPWPQKFFIVKRRPYSQAGRRGFESRLPLHLFNNLHALPNQLLSHLSQLEVNRSDSSALKSDQSADDASRLRASDESTYSARWTPRRSEERRVGKECRSRWSPH